MGIRRLWLTDDDEDEHLLFRELIDEIDPAIEVDCCLNGLQLLFKLNHSLLLPDVIFLDINMPFKSGHEILKEIKTDKRFSSIPVIIYSTSANTADIASAYHTGAKLYVRKAVDLKEFKNRIQKVFGKISEVMRIPFDEFVC